MDFHLDRLLNLPNVTVFTCQHQEDLIILKLDLLNEGTTCPHCQNYTDHIHQTRPILVRDLPICGQGVYLHLPRRQFYCPLTPEQVQDIFSRMAERKKKDWGEPEKLSLKVIGEVFPNALIVIDRFQVMKLELNQLLYLSPCLSIAYELKEELRDIYENSTTVKMGMRKLTKWLTSARVIFGTTAETIERHLLEICHYFINRTTSGVMEGLNNKIKLILRQSYGFKNFDLMREKLLACLF